MESLKRELTIVPKYSEDGAGIPIYHETMSWFGVPLFHFRPHEIPTTVVDKRITSPILMKFRKELRPGQQDMIDKFKAMVDKGQTGFIVEAPPGFGKTVTAIYMMAMLKQRALVVVPRSNLIKQWIDRLLTYSDLKKSDIGWIEGGKGVWRDRKVVVSLVHSLVLDRLGPEFKRHFGVVVFDEVDRSVPPHTFAPAIAMFPAKYRIGMSATLKRQDGMEVVFYKHLGQNFLRGSDEGRMKPTILLHYFMQTSGFVPMLRQKLNRRGMLLSRLSVNKNRNEIIARYAQLIWKSDRKCVILSDRKEQLASLFWMLTHGWGIPGKEIGYYVRSMPGRKITDADRRKTASACRIILATYGMIALGTDIQDLAGLIFATPQSDVEQSKGRIERFLEGKKDPVIVDVVDTYYQDTLGWAAKRQKHYRSKGLTIKRVQ